MTPVPTSSPAPDARHARWRVLALLFVCRTTLGLQFQAMGSTADPLMAQFGLSHTEIGTLVGLFMLPGLLLSAPVGRLGARHADRLLLVFGLMVMATGSGLGALAQGFGWLAASRLLVGTGFVFGTVYFTKVVADWFAGLELATAMSVLVMAWPMGIAMGQVGHTWLAANVGWSWAFGVAALASATAAMAVGVLYRPSPAAPTAAATGAQGQLTAAEWRLTLVAAAAWGLFNAGYVVFLSFAPRLLQLQGYSLTQAAGTISLASWVMIGSATAAGRVADRCGRPALVAVACLLLGSGSLLLLHMPGLALPMTLAFGLLGAAPGGIIIALSARSMAPQRRARGMGVFYSLYFIIVTAAPPVAGWLFDRSGSARLTVGFAALLFVACTVCYAAFEPLRRRWPVA